MEDIRNVKNIINLCLLFFLPFNLYSYSIEGGSTSSHGLISKRAFSEATNFKENFFNKLYLSELQTFVVGFESKTAEEWVIEGSLREDAEPLQLAVPINAETRTLFHFFDPVFNTGLSFLPWNYSSPSMNWAIDGQGSLHLNLLIAGIPVYIPNAQFSNEYSYKKAREYYYNGLTNQTTSGRYEEFGKMFRALGQIIHLLQDCSVPEHARNDPHMGMYPFGAKGLYEKIALGYTSIYLQEPYIPNVLTPYDFFTESSQKGLANFTNSQFISQGTTNFPNILNTYPSPVPNTSLQSTESFENLLWGNYSNPHQACISCGYTYDQCLSNVNFIGNYVYDAYNDNTYTNKKLTSFSLFDMYLINSNQLPSYSVNRFICKEQASFLIPRAVGYSAGLIDYFFRGNIEASIGVNDTLTIYNMCDEDTMDGVFSLYYETNSGDRQLVVGAEWNESIPPYEQVSGLHFIPPSNVLSPSFFLVFKGKLGSENESVCGTKVFTNYHKLTITIAGNGSGIVSSAPNGINCGNTCEANFNSDVPVFLTPQPSSNSFFSGWTGAYSYYNGQALVYVISDTVITANFSLKPMITNFTVNNCNCDTWCYQTGSGSQSCYARSLDIDCSWDISPRIPGFHYQLTYSVWVPNRGGWQRTVTYGEITDNTTSFHIHADDDQPPIGAPNHVVFSINPSGNYIYDMRIIDISDLNCNYTP